MENLTFVSKFTSHGIKRYDFAFIHIISRKKFRKKSLIKYVAVDLHKATFVVQGNYKCTITIAFHSFTLLNLISNVLLFKRIKNLPTKLRYHIAK